MAPQEPRIAGVYGIASSGSHESNDFIREIWGLKPLISAGGYMRDPATRAAERGNEFARWADTISQMHGLFPHFTNYETD